jgi:outer membrane protein assembly factor BamB
MFATQGGWKTQSVNSQSSFKINIVLSKNNLYLVDAIGNFFCIDALLGTKKWNIKSINLNGLIILNPKGELILPTIKNEILFVSPKLGKVTSEIKLSAVTKDEFITDIIVNAHNIFIGFSNGWIYKTKSKQKPEKFFRGGSAPVVSLTNIDGEFLVTDYDGKFTILNISAGKK